MELVQATKPLPAAPAVLRDSTEKVPGSVKLQINSFMTKKEKESAHNNYYGYPQNLSNDSTATNTIAVHPTRRSVNKPLEPKKGEPEMVHLTKSVLKPAVNKKPQIVPMVKLGKTPDKVRVSVAQASPAAAPIIKLAASGSKTRNKTPAIRLALITQQPQPQQSPLMGAMKRYGSKKDIEKHLKQTGMPGMGPVRSRNQCALENSLIVRTKPEEENGPMISHRKQYPDRRSSVVKPRNEPENLKNAAPTTKLHYKTFYGNKLVGEEPKKEKKNAAVLKMVVRKLEKSGSKVVSKSVIESAIESRKKETDESEILADSDDDDDDCKTVIENNCDNDYSLICNSLNGVFP